MNFDTVILENTLRDYTEALVLAAATFTLLWAAKKLLSSFLKKQRETKARDIDRALYRMVSYTKTWFYAAVSVFAGSQLLELSPNLSALVEGVFVVALVAQVVILSSIFLQFFLRYRFARGKSATTKSAIEIVGNVGTALLWVLGVLFVLSNFGVEVTSLIAGLGIGGLAVALALQGVLGDLFSSLAIYFDKPFEVGDFIEYNGQAGTVKHIGMKTTRIQLLRGEELVVTNKELSEGRVQNYNELTERRIATSFGVVYQTPAEKLEQIPEVVKGIVESTEKTRFDRAHFSAFGDSALIFEMVYYVEDDAYDVYMDAQQKINLGIVRAFEGEGIDMAYPTQTLYIKKES